MALEIKSMKQVARKITLKKASAGEIIADLNIVPAEERRAMAAVVSVKRILGLDSMPVKKRAIAAKPSVTAKLRSSCK
ncbi:MAG: hypothetical protein AABZ34_03015 [Nitrospirota bacterium]